MQVFNLKAGSLLINNVTQRKGFILGGTGTGKTTTLKLIALNSPVPVYVFDPLNVMFIKGFQRVLITKKSIAESKKAGTFFNSIKISKGVIFAFNNLLQNEIVEFCEGFFSSFHPHDCLIIFDELHEVCGYNIGEKSQEVERVWRHGRNQNVGFIGDSQRPAMVDKNVLALTDYLIAFRLTWTHDIDALTDVLKNVLKKEEVDAIISKIQTKDFLQGYVFDFQPGMKNDNAK